MGRSEVVALAPLRRRLGVLLLAALLCGHAPRRAAGLNCFSEMNYGWCEFNRANPGEPPSCPNYTFSIAGFQRKLDSHYNEGGRPPLTEAFFLMRLHPEYHEGLINMDCPTPLVFAHMLVAEFMMVAPPWDDVGYGWRLQTRAVTLAKEASPFQQHLMVAIPAAWPFRRALNQLKVVQAASELASERASLGAAPRVAFVVAHCREELDWVGRKLGNVPAGSILWIYEKCGQATQAEDLGGGADKFAAVYVVPRPDRGRARGDECSAYLAHIVVHYSRLADYTIFLQSDPHEHLHFDFLDVVLRSLAVSTFDLPYLALNGPRHVRTLTPCLQAVHEEIFGENLTQLVGPYCCAQFVASREVVLRRSEQFYARMLSLVDGTRTIDLCGLKATKRSSQCYGFEFLWHIVFGESPDPPYREDDRRLPVALRLKHGREHTRQNWLTMPLARDIPLKMVPDFETSNPMEDL